MTGRTSVGAAGWAFLVFAGLLLPLAAMWFASLERRRMAAPFADGATDAELPRLALYAQVLFTHALLFTAATAAARVSGVRLFARTTLEPRDVGAALLALVAVVALGEISWRSRSAAERERLWVRRILPRTTAERRAWVLVSAGAAIAEEVAYRGAFVSFAFAATGSLPLAIVASAAAFAAVHAPQGVSGVGYVFLIALLHHALVLVTGTLVLAIAVHFVYDVLAGLWLARRHGL